MLEARISFDSLLERLDYSIWSGINGEPVMKRASEYELAVCKALEGNMLKSNKEAILSIFQNQVCVVENNSTKTVLRRLYWRKEQNVKHLTCNGFRSLQTK